MGEYRYLSRREQEIMEIMRRRGTATASDVQQALSGTPTIFAVRAWVAVLGRKGLLRRVGSSNGSAVYEAVDSGEDI